MVKRVDRPYWVNWLRWQLYHRHIRRKMNNRRTAWKFINHIRSMPPGSLVIDGGANVGRVTVAFRRQGFEVHAFEPDPVAQKEFNARFGDDPLVHLHPAALGAREGRLALFRSWEFGKRPVKSTVSSSLIPRMSHDTATPVEVDVVDFVAFVKSLGRPVDLVKLDVEGSEVEILERVIAEELDKEIGAIFAETHERHGLGDLAERTAVLRAEIRDRGIGNIYLDWF